jgi:O-antigen/teichoic acid export membrane protein
VQPEPPPGDALAEPVVPQIGNRRRTAGDAATIVGAQLIGLAATLALTPIQLERMGNDRYGLVALAVAAVGLFNFLDYGLSWATLRYVPALRGAQAADDVASVFVTAAAVVGLSASLLGAVALIVAELVGLDVPGWDDSLGVVVLSLVLLPVLMTSNVLSAVTRALGHFRLAALVFAASFVSTNVIWALVAGHERDVELVIGSQVVLSALSATFWFVQIRRAGLPRLRLVARLSGSAHWRAMGTFAGYSALVGLSTSLFVTADKVAFAAGVGVAQLALYAIVVALCSRIALVSSALTSVVFPQLSAAYAADKNQEYSALSNWALKTVVLATVAVASGLFWAGHDFFEIWISPTFADDAAVSLQLLACGFALEAIGQIGYSANDARGHVKRTMSSGFACAGAGLPAAAVVSSRWGLTAGVAVLAFALAVHGVIGLLLGFGRPRRRALIPTLGYALPIFLGVGLASGLAHALGTGPWGSLIASLVTALGLLVLEVKTAVGGNWRWRL